MQTSIIPANEEAAKQGKRLQDGLYKILEGESDLSVKLKKTGKNE